MDGLLWINGVMRCYKHPLPSHFDVAKQKTRTRIVVYSYTEQETSRTTASDIKIHRPNPAFDRFLSPRFTAQTCSHIFHVFRGFSRVPTVFPCRPRNPNGRAILTFGRRANVLIPIAIQQLLVAYLSAPWLENAPFIGGESPINGELNVDLSREKKHIANEYIKTELSQRKRRTLLVL